MGPFAGAIAAFPFHLFFASRMLEGRAPDPDPLAQPGTGAGTEGPVGKARCCWRGVGLCSMGVGGAWLATTVHAAALGLIKTRHSTAITCTHRGFLPAAQLQKASPVGWGSDGTQRDFVTGGRRSFVPDTPRGFGSGAEHSFVTGGARMHRRSASMV